MSANKFLDICDELHFEEIGFVEEYEFGISNVFSANNRWAPGVAYGKNGKPYGFLRLVDEAGALTDEVATKVSPLAEKLKDLLPRVRSVVIYANICLPRNKLINGDNTLKRNDLSNMWLVIENGISKGTGLDDKLSCMINLTKSFSLDDKYYVKIRMHIYGVNNG